MTEKGAHEASLEGVLAAIRIMAEHIGMSADSRRRLAVAIGDQPEVVEPVVPPDPRDLELAELKRQLAAARNPEPAFSEQIPGPTFPEIPITLKPRKKAKA